MLFSRFALFALPAIVAGAVLPRDDQCHMQTSQFCCNNLQNANALSSAQQKLVSLAGFQVGNAMAQFGFACTPISALGVASSSCKTYNVCCQNSSATGLVAINCSPIIISP